METVKHYLGSSDSQMLGIDIHRVVKSLARISKVEWRNVIYTGRDQEVWMGRKTLSVGWDGRG